MQPEPSRAEPYHPDAILDPGAIVAALRAANFDVAHVAELYEDTKTVQDLPLLRRRARNFSGPFSLATQLFSVGLPVTDAALAGLFPPDLTAQLAASRLLYHEPDGWRSRSRLDPLGKDLWLLSDYHLDAAPLAPDYVLMHGASSKTVQNVTPLRRFERVLDVGCGAGGQSLLAARHAGRVVGTDINPRALNFARMSARLNGIDNVEFRHGSFFEPVQGETFDLIVCNPPYVISPDNYHVYRTGSAEGDSVCEHVVRSLPGYLQEGGLAVTLLNWHHPANPEQWAARPVSWTEHNGCDNWFSRLGGKDPLDYAHTWLQGEDVSQADSEAKLDEWLEYYGRLGIGYISAGIMALRRRSTGTNWTRTGALTPAGPNGGCGDHLERIIAGETYVLEHPDDAVLLGARFRLHPDHVMNTHFTASGGEWKNGPMVLSPQPGFRFSLRLDAFMATLVASLDGTQPLGELIARCAERHGAPPQEAVAPCLGVTRRLLCIGLLTPVA